MDELILNGDVQFKPAEIKFPKYAELKQNALDLADRISTVEVTEENIKTVKKDLAQVRKIVTELNNRRKLVKSEILKDYNTFESQIKEIDGIIASAEDQVRTQVKVIEEQERDKKYEAIRAIWDKRIRYYTISEFGDFFERWLQPQYLNKTESMRKIESDMVAWLEARERDIAILKLQDAEYFIEYFETFNLAAAIEAVNRRKELRKSIILEDNDTETAEFVITGTKDIKLTEAILKENEINYRRIK